MTLSAKGRIEIYVPDPLDESYTQVLAALEEEFTFNFGGCSIVRGIDGHYLSDDGAKDSDRINLIYTDTPFTFEENLNSLTVYMTEIRSAVGEALKLEESILVAAYPVFHSS